MTIANTPIQISTATGNKKRAAKAEANSDAILTALAAIQPGNVGAFVDGLTAPQKTALLKSLVLKLVEYEHRLNDLESR